ncbi:ABC transporter, ATP-binding protein [Dictyocaulus viviparus]|uniref:ABC transporter, ATP-binding protein n=1 Tax=Dictyocaulus viviparus TaxID=29172 RepID=A0A0D8XHV0_DICVI|nr:ABC transporter, ATP-binding protein [Dictyocaulus viviparus]
MFLVEERIIKFAHQQMLTGISPTTFWATSFSYDFVFYSIICSCFLTVFLLSNWMQGYLHFLVLLLVLYFWSCVPFVYAVSFMFSSPSKANVLLFLWQLIAAFAAMVIMFVISQTITVDPTIAELIRSILLCVLPSFAFGNAVMTVGLSSAAKTPQQLLWQWNMLGKNLSFMFIFGCLSTLLFVLFQFKTVRYRWYQIWDLRFGRKNYGRIGVDDEDSAVLEERACVQRCSDDFTLEVKDLCKMYGRFRALDRLTMGVRNGECFGLLGENGAGKTTTFNILTGQSFATSGAACIDKKDVTNTFTLRSSLRAITKFYGANCCYRLPIGYCPQFDALMYDFTGKEILEILARMHGFPNPAEIAELVLQNIGMLDHANKLVRYYSGGQRRKISIGLAILAPTPIIILDEPTAGIDPKARRDIWEVLSMVRDNSQTSLLLSSHSMDECEALCSRIAVLHKGRMIAIGTSQQLKTKFGNSYTITMVAPKLEYRATVIEGVKRAFPNAVFRTPKESLSLTLKWQIPKSKSDRWSTLFSKMLSLAASLNVVDFCVTQSSLEETFYNLSLYNKEKMDETQNSSV